MMIQRNENPVVKSELEASVKCRILCKLSSKLRQIRFESLDCRFYHGFSIKCEQQKELILQKLTNEVKQH